MTWRAFGFDKMKQLCIYRNMRRFYLILFIALFNYTSASACSCLCPGGEKVSEFFEDSKLFWGVPIQHYYSERSWTYNDVDYTETQVTTQVRVIEGYGQFANGSVIETVSSLDDGVSCGYQYELNKLHLITAYGPKNGVGSCNCPPPLSLSIDYLTQGKDQYLPRDGECESAKRRRDPIKRDCRIVEKSWDKNLEFKTDTQAKLQAQIRGD